jgi:hypothetical protein
VVLIILLAVSAGFADVEIFRLSSQIESNQLSDTHALCAYRNDLRTRYESGVQYLLTHPNGIAGVSRVEIQQSLTNEQHALNALSSLKC